MQKVYLNYETFYDLVTEYILNWNEIFSLLIENIYLEKKETLIFLQKLNCIKNRGLSLLVRAWKMLTLKKNLYFVDCFA